MKMTAAIMFEQGLKRPFAQSQSLKIETVDLEGPGAGEVLVRIAAATGDKPLFAMTLANIVARMERSEIRDSRDAGPGLRFAPSGLQRRDLSDGLFRVQCARQKYSAFPVGQIISTSSRHPVPRRGAYHDRHERWDGMRWTRQRQA